MRIEPKRCRPAPSKSAGSPARASPLSSPKSNDKSTSKDCGKATLPDHANLRGPGYHLAQSRPPNRQARRKPENIGNSARRTHRSASPWSRALTTHAGEFSHNQDPLRTFGTSQKSRYPGARGWLLKPPLFAARKLEPLERPQRVACSAPSSGIFRLRSANGRNLTNEDAGCVGVYRSIWGYTRIPPYPAGSCEIIPFGVNKVCGRRYRDPEITFVVGQVAKNKPFEPQLLCDVLPFQVVETIGAKSTVYNTEGLLLRALAELD